MLLVIENHCDWFANLLISLFLWSSLTFIYDPFSGDPDLYLAHRQYCLTSNKARVDFGCLPVLCIDVAESSTQ